MKNYNRLQEVLAEWPADVPVERFAVSCEDRLRRALRAMREGTDDVGPADVAGLVRDVLRRQSLLLDERDLPLLVPRAERWPNREMWQAHGMYVTLETENSFQVRSQAWYPGWLPASELDKEPPLDAAFAGKPRRRLADVTADPCIADVTGFATYRSPGQREAVRAAFLVQPSATLLINLPTGDGKSLAAFAPALAGIGTGTPALSLVVVPTVALALDLARRFHEHLHRVWPHPLETPSLAYYGGLPEDTKGEVRRCVSSGTQPILFISPEGAVGALRPALFRAAERGFLRFIVVDEAHLVAQWGTEFRPEYQALAGIHRALLEACPEDRRFRTLLMTATLTVDALKTLETLFAPEGLEVVSAMHLRPEPSYWVHHSANELQRRESVLEVVRHAPRPFILYVVRPAEAEAWTRRLRDGGLRRIATVHGGTSSTVRGSILDRWNARELDGVVATSAFGLGMDQADVRTIIHACVPETVDRFYQEVGRGGRDGLASLSFLLYTTADVRVAQELGRRRVIGIEKGRKRWEDMFSHGRRLDETGTIVVPLDVRPTVDADSEANVAWNVRTLTLLARAGLISLEAALPPDIDQGDDERDEAYARRREEAYQEYYRHAAVRILAVDHREETVWEQYVEPERSRTIEADREVFAQMERLLAGETPFADILRDTYTVPPADIRPEVVRGTCPVSRHDPSILRGWYDIPVPMHPVQRVMCDVDPRLLGAIGPMPERGFVSYDSNDKETHREESLLRLLRLAVRSGVREIAATDDWLTKEEYRRLYRYAPERFVVHRSLGENDPFQGAMPLPRASILNPDAAASAILGPLLEIQRPFHVVLLPDSVSQPGHPDRRFIDVNEHMKIQEFLRRMDEWEY